MKKLKNFFSKIGLPIRWAPVPGFFLFILKTLDALVPVFQVLLLSELIDSLGTENLNFIFFLLLTIVYSRISGNLRIMAEQKMILELKENLNPLIIEKIASLQYKYIEDEETYNLTQRISSKPEEILKNVYLHSLGILSLTVKIIGLSLIICSVLSARIFLLLVLAVPFFILSFRGGQKLYKSNRNLTNYEKFYRHFSDVLTGRNFAYERTVYGYTDFFIDFWKEKYSSYSKEYIKNTGKRFLNMNIGTLITCIFSVTVAYSMLIMAGEGKITAGLFMSLCISLSSLIRVIFSELPWNVSKLSEGLSFIDDLDEFEKLSSDKEYLTTPSPGSLNPNSLEFRSVSFKYPGSCKYALEDFSFRFLSGSSYSLTGANGSGKSTLIKLMLGLFTEYEGVILIDGKNIKEYGSGELKSLFSVVFQDFARYSVSLGDNIRVGRISKPPEDKEILKVMKDLDLDTEKDLTIETEIGKIYGSARELSGGQWQKTAIARSYISAAPFLILDEPTSSLDPISESTMYQRFMDLSCGKTTILVSHRLGSTKISQCILVLKGGRLEEWGSHNDLIKKTGFIKRCTTLRKGGMKMKLKIKDFGFILKIVSECNLKWLISYIFLSFLFSLSFNANTVVTALFFTKVQNFIGGSGLFSDALLWLIIWGALNFLVQFMNTAFNFIFSVFSVGAEGNLKNTINLRCKTIEAVNYESYGFLNSLEKTEESVNGIISFIATVIMVFSFYLPYLIFSGVILFSLDRRLILVLPMAAIPVFFSFRFRLKKSMELEDDSSALRRKTAHFKDAITDRSFFKETRILGAYNFFLGKYRESLGELLRKNWDYRKKSGLLDLKLKLIILSGYLGVIILLFSSARKGIISPGFFLALFSSLETMFALMEELIYFHLGSVAENSICFMNYISFIKGSEYLLRGEKYKSEHNVKNEKNPDLYGNIVLENITFSYPGSEKPVIENLSLEIGKNESIAIVGFNGSGKTTLSKLISGIYKPDKGNVFIGGRNTSDITDYNGLTVLYQNFNRYAATLRENIKLSDSGSLKEVETGDLLKDISPDTRLIKEFGGTELSGGQWQQTAILRALYRQHQILILDEPTSAIDPIEEDNIYSIFRKAGEGKTSVIITHRISAAAIADKIIVMDKGKITDSGMHRELLEKSPLYSRMVSEQRRWYERQGQ